MRMRVVTLALLGRIAEVGRSVVGGWRVGLRWSPVYLWVQGSLEPVQRLLRVGQTALKMALARDLDQALRR